MLRMKQRVHQQTWGVLIAGAAALVLALLTLNAATTAAQPALAGRVERDPQQAGRAAPPRVSPSGSQQPITASRDVESQPRQTRRWADAGNLPAAMGDLELSKVAITAFGLDGVVSNGDRITYALTITNTGLTAVEVITLYDTLPAGLEDIRCHDGCHPVVEQQPIPSPLGGTILVDVTTEVTWSIQSLQPSSVTQRVFSGRVIGQPDGALIHNTADLEYLLAGKPGVAVSNETATTVRVRVATEGAATLAGAPTWLSSDLGGTLSLDWGDFDRDGNLDLALGSTVGTNVYRYDPEAGRLVHFWGNDRYTLGVRWADFDGDGVLELVAVGDSVGYSAVASGTNYIYQRGGDGFTELDRFTTDLQLLRVEPGYYPGRNRIDLLASTNAIDADCPVRLYRNKRGSDPFRDPYDICVSHEATANIAPGDYDNDDDLELALGVFPNETQLLPDLSGGTPLPIAPSTTFLPYDFAWGDYDRDGYLDLAAAYPLDRKARIYHNQNGKGFTRAWEVGTGQFRTPQAVDWGDFNGDGYLDLAVADAPPRIYFNVHGSFSLTHYIALPQEVAQDEIWAMAVADHDNDGDLDLALGNRDGASLLFISFAPFLDTRLTGIGSWQASSVAWGDVVGDGYLDLLFGSGARTFNTRLYRNQAGAFPTHLKLDSKYGPHSVAVGDVDRDGRLDVALGATWLQDRIYLSRDKPGSGEWAFAYALATSSRSLAWGDVEGDGDLDLLVGGEGPNALYVNRGTALDTTPAWTSGRTDDTYSVAWGDYDGDGYPDFAVGNNGQPNRVYHNDGDGTFSLGWISVEPDHTRSVAWGDYDRDGDLDLAVGNYGELNRLYENDALGFTLVWTSTYPDASPVLSKTTSLAWGDWDNDGDLDLAVGNEGQSDQVYTNQDSEPGSPRLLWLWTSEEHLRTSGIAWGDRDDDGDLDLAVSQLGAGQNGFYENNYVGAAHLTDSFLPATTLPNSPSYVVITRPGTIDDAYFFSSWELLAYTSPLTVAVDYKLYDPDGTRIGSSNEPGDSIVSPTYEFSLDGGSTWHPASITPTFSFGPSETFRQGQEYAVVWDPRAEWDRQQVAAISDDARFRITVVHQNPLGPVQRASTRAVSPPFRVRATTCRWPVGPSIALSPAAPQAGEEVTFEGALLAGEGPLAFAWDFGDGTGAQGQLVRHTYAADGLYRVRMTVTSPPCPLVRVVTATRTLVVGRGALFYLPLVFKSATGDGAAARGSRWAPETDVRGFLQVGAERAEPAPADQQLSASPEVTAATLPAAGPASSGSVFPRDVTTSTSTANTAITHILPGIHSQPSIDAHGSHVAFWSTASVVPYQATSPVISEVDPREYYDAVEFHNPTAVDVDMTGWGFTAIRTTGVTRYTFPAFTLASGAYVVLHEEAGTNTATDLYMNENIWWYHGAPGSASLVDAGGQGVDFVRWGTASDSPPAGTTWINPNPPSPPDEPLVLARADESLDANAGLDWCTQAPSRGGPNAGCDFDDSGNIEVLLAEDLAAPQPTFAEVTVSTGNILGGFNLWPTLSADGARTAFFSDRDFDGNNADENFEIYIAERGADGRIEPTQVTSTTGGANLWPSISADGSRIAFASDRHLDGRANNRDGNQEIFLAELAPGGDVTFTQVTSTSSPVINDQPSISAGGNHLAFSSNGDLTGENDDTGQGYGNREIFTARIGAGETLTLTQVTGSTGGANVWPVLSAAGTHVVFASDRDLDGRRINADGNQEIVLAEISAGLAPTFTQITSSTGRVNDQPSISDGGTRLAFVSDDEIWLYDHLDRTAARLSVAGDSNSRPSISGDGLNVAFAADHEIYWLALADLGVTKFSDPPDIAVPGEPLTYTIVFVNRGARDVSGADLADTLPAEISNPAWTCTAVNAGLCNTPPGSELNNTVSISVGGAITYTATGIVDACVTGTLTNTAEVTAPPGVDQLEGNNVKTITTALAPEADLSLRKTADPGTVVAGGTLTYTLVYTHAAGSSCAHGIVLTDTLPAGVTFGGMKQGPDPLPPTGRVLTWTLSTLAVGASGTLEFTATVASWVPTGTLTNTAGITTTSHDINPMDNRGVVTTTVTTSADLAVTKTVAPDTVEAGGTLTYTLVYANHGLSDAQEVYLTDTLPISVTWDGTALAAGAPLDGPTQAAVHTWYWYTPTLRAGATGIITFAVVVSEDLEASVDLTNRVTITASTDDAVDINNRDSATAGVVGAAVELSKTVYLGHDRGDGCPGSEVVTGTIDADVTYCFHVLNSGDTYLDDITITDGDLGIPPNTVTRKSGRTPLAPGASTVYYFQGSLDVSLVNTAAVEANPTDSRGHDLPGVTSPTDTDSAAVVVLPSAPSNLVATAVSETQIDLSWTDNSSDETAFHVERSPDGTTGWAEIVTVGANVTTYSDAGRACETAYYYRVRAYRSSDGLFSGYSSVDSATTAPCHPTGLAAAVVSETQIDLSWTDNASTETGFRIERSLDGVSNWTEIDTAGADATTYSDSGADCDTTYYYRVRAYRSSDGLYSGYSNVDGATTAPCHPTGLTATAVSQTQIDLSWADNSSSETAFYVERSPDGNSWTALNIVAQDGTTYSDSGLSCDETYHYRVRAYRSSDGLYSGYSNEDNATTAPCDPTGLSATAVSETQIDLSWTDASSSETGFRIERSPDGASNWTEIDTAGAGATTYSDDSADCDTTYYYRVRAYRSGDGLYSGYSNVDSATTAPCQPTGLTATAVSQTRIDLSWTDASSSETGFRIERSPDGSAWAFLANVAQDATTYSHTGLGCDETHYYRVRAERSGDGLNSAYSNVDSATTAPCDPSGLSATAASETQIDLSWTDNSSSETGFRIERSPDGSAWAFLANVAQDATTYSDTGLGCDETHYYRVRAERSGDGLNSGYSDVDSATTAPCQPTGLAATAVSGTQIDLSWTDNSSTETGFRIERSSSGSLWAFLADVAQDATSYSHTSLACATTYYYRVRAERSGDNLNSGFSNVANATTQACPSPNPPSGLNRTATSRSRIHLTWLGSASGGDSPVDGRHRLMVRQAIDAEAGQRLARGSPALAHTTPAGRPQTRPALPGPRRSATLHIVIPI
jgi:uncharacterized repeat protein (TIGR01451 family)